MKKHLPKGWYSRGYLPHFDGGACVQFLTYRLADSMPQEVLEKWRLELEREEISETDFRRRVEYYLDQNYGKCYLRRQDVAEMIEENLQRFDGEKYKLYAWVIMPNHLHLLLTPINGFSLSEIVHSCKSYTASKANRLLGRAGRFWFPEPFDRFIRNSEHFEKTRTYIENNPVKAKLCNAADEWQFSSACKNKKL